MANEPLQLNLGSLRSAMALTLHTHHASRIWHGRTPAEGRPGIIGLNGFISIMNKLKRGGEQVDRALADVPPALSLGENLNVQPVKLPLFVNSQLGFMAVYLLADYDDLARRLILAHHTALIDRSTLERWLNDGAHALRSLFSLAQQYRYSGTTRNDFAAKNAAARAALEKFGELPTDVLEGTRRSRFAPPINRRSSQDVKPEKVENPSAAPADEATDDDAKDDDAASDEDEPA